MVGAMKLAASTAVAASSAPPTSSASPPPGPPAPFPPVVVSLPTHPMGREETGDGSSGLVVSRTPFAYAPSFIADHYSA